MTRIQQTWDLGDGEVTVAISHAKPFPPSAYAVVAAIADNLATHADGLRHLLDEYEWTGAQP